MAESPPYKIKVGDDIEDADLLSFVIERDMFQPDMATIVVSNPAGPYSSVPVAAKVTVEVGKPGGEELVKIYEGEVVGIEAFYKGGEKTRITFRAMNKFHRLLRHRKSITFADKTDQEILKAVANDAELSLKWKHDKNIPYKHVYQHNQTDMEFLRMRAGRMGCHVWCVGDDLFVQQPDLQSPKVKTLTTGAAAKESVVIKSFSPRLSSASIVKKVTVKGWNPEKKELITGEYSAAGSRLGSQNAVAGSGKLGEEETFTVDHPIWSKEEADALAKARLVDLSLSYITGECEIPGEPSLELGTVVEVIANEEPATAAGDPFNGNYYIMGITHRLVLSKTKDGGYTTILRLARDAQKK